MTGLATPADPIARGKQIRTTVPRTSHAEWVATIGRTDPVTLITDQDTDSLPSLVQVGSTVRVCRTISTVDPNLGRAMVDQTGIGPQAWRKSGLVPTEISASSHSSAALMA